MIASIDGELLAVIDRELERMRTERPGLQVTRSDVARDLLYRALRGSKAKP